MISCGVKSCKMLHYLYFFQGIFSQNSKISYFCDNIDINENVLIYFDSITYINRILVFNKTANKMPV